MAKPGRQGVPRAHIVGRVGRILAVVMVLAMGACGATRPTATPATSEDLKDFQKIMLADAKKSGDFQQKTKNGKNISEFSMGWFIYDVLTELSSMDDGLYDYFNKGSHDLQSYLRTDFHDNPDSEIAKVDALAQQDHPALRHAAAAALTTLLHIPNDSDPTETQADDRRKLAEALGMLKQQLQRCAEEAGQAGGQTQATGAEDGRKATGTEDGSKASLRN